MEEIADRILKLLGESQQSLLKREVMQQLNIGDKKLFYQALDYLEREGSVSVSKSRRVHLKKKEPELTATIVSLSKGFAFARPDDGSGDIFIHADRLKSAFLGDKVSLNHVQQSEKGPSADVDAILEKSARSITGTLHSTGRYAEIDPDGAIRYSVGVNARGGLSAKEGDKVQAEVHRLPHTSRLEAKIVKVYGNSGSARICSDAIVDRNGIRSVFPEEVLAEARKVSLEKITEEELRARSDLRDLPICTIDGASAKDLDDAVSVQKTERGYRLGVHIADVSHYVREGGAVDAEARERGTSVYFADRVIPMLPEELSNGVCSLNAGQDKLAFSAMMELDAEGGFLSYEFHKSVIRSKVRGVYSEVNSLFDGTADAALLEKYAPVTDSLRAARELAGVLKRRSKGNGTFDIDSSESEFVLDENGVCVDVRPRKSGEAEQMIEQLMITANQAAAKLAEAEEIPFVYRVHEQPDPERVESLAELVGALGLNPRTLRHKGGFATSDFADIMEQANGTPAQKVISHQLLRTMAKARYDAKPLGHFGLALEDYCHFTSPIRRYPDTSIHRILSALLAGAGREELIKRYGEFAVESAKSSSAAEVHAMMAERSAEDCYKAEYMTRHVGECFDGVVSGVTMRGVFVELENTVEGFVPMESFESADYQFDGVLTQVDAKTGAKLTIGDRLSIRVVSAEVASGRIDFAPAEQTLKIDGDMKL